MKNIKFIGWSLVLLLLIGAISCKKKVSGDGPVVTQPRNPAEFTRIELQIDATTYVTQEGPSKVTIEAQQNILDIIETPVIGNELRIRYQHNKRVGSHAPVIVRISNPVINGLDVDGSGDLLVTNALHTNALDLDISGSGSIKAGEVVVTGPVSANISGSGGILALSGRAESGSFKISGSGWIDLLPIECKTATADISGSGNIKTTVTQQLDARISGSGSVLYLGSPTISTKISGSGSVRKL